VNRFRWTALLLATLLSACDTPTSFVDRLPPADAIPLDIPSDAETVFAETRDFTVVGYFDVPLTRPGDVRIELFAGESAEGQPVRVIQSRVDPATGVTPRAALDFGYAAGQAWGPDGPVTDPARIVMTPDLVAAPGGIENPTNKVVVTHEYYAGVILGGVSRTFDTQYAAGGIPWIDLVAGAYTIRVSGLSGQLAGLEQTKRIEFGRTHAMLGRFSPANHRDALLDFAAASGYRTYIDFFPGFFAHDGYSFEVPGRWMANNSIEVVNTAPHALVDDIAAARNNVLLYNISPSSATNRIEIGAIIANGLLGPQTTFHYYDTGEPVITWVDAVSGELRAIEGTIETFPHGDRLAVTRVEIRTADGVLEDNLHDVGSDAPTSLDTNVDDGVSVRTTDEFRVFGVVTPIPAGTQPGELAHQYEMDNSIEAIRYHVRTADGDLVHTWTRATGLGRRYSPVDSPDQVALSMYEFAHELHIGNDGEYTISLTGLDAEGQAVPGTTESFAVTVGSAVGARLPGRSQPWRGHPR
jgi:hypothetical protein